MIEGLLKGSLIIDHLLAPKFLLILALVSSYFVTHLTIPVVVRIARGKQLMNGTDSRSPNFGKTPKLGGIGIFMALAIVFVLISHLMPDRQSQAYLIFPSLAILFFIGLKDDILIIAPYKKLTAQILAGSLFIVFTDIRVGSMFGIFDIYQLPYMVSFIFTLFVIIAVIYAYSLIDGIDGLASSLGIIVCITFGIYFYLAGLIWVTVLCITLIGTLSSFIQFNFSSIQKVFMGDSGSLIVGFVLAILAIKFIQLNETPHAVYIESAPILAIAILRIPLFDALRLFIQRIASGRNPFLPDRNNVHHLIIDSGFSHLQATVILCSTSAFVIVASFFTLAKAAMIPSLMALTISFMAYFLIVRKPAMNTGSFPAPHVKQKKISGELHRKSVAGSQLNEEVVL